MKMSNKDYESVNRTTKDILRKKGLIIMKKVARAGGSYSLQKNSIDMNIKLAHIVPSHIFLEQVCVDLIKEGVDERRIVKITGNSKFCLKEKQFLEKNNHMKKYRMSFKHNCNNCKLYDECEMKKIIENKFDYLIITAKKLENISIDSPIYDALSYCDACFFDEVSSYLFNSVESIKDKHNILSRTYNYLFNSEGNDSFNKMCIAIMELLNVIEEEFMGLSNETYKVIRTDIYFPELLFEEHLFINLQKDIRRLINEYNFPIINIISILLDFIYKGNIVIQKDYLGKKIISGVPSRNIFNNIGDLFRQKLIILTDAGFPDTRVKNERIKLRFDKLLNVDSEEIILENKGDPKKTNESFYIYCDSFNISITGNTDDIEKRKRFEDFTNIINGLNYEVFQVYPKKDYLLNETNENLTSHNRSSDMRGVRCKHNSKIVIQYFLPNIPSNALLPLAETYRLFIEQKGKTIMSLEKANKILNLFELITTCCNNYPRHKDPLGRFNTILCAYGQKKNKIEQYFTIATDGSSLSKPRIIEPYKKGSYLLSKM